MDNPKNKIADRIKETNNVLVTVSANPSVDQLSAAIGLTLLLSKLNKHATAVFSGQVPSTIEFLKPEETLEDNTDSLRDFIIALDKSKADKLRYKVEDKMVKIFITPYRTSIGEEDLEFSEGDFNVDIVIALGVHTKEELDQAITSHGRILHDATVATVNTTEASELGSLNWNDPHASSLCEMVVALADLIKANSLDAQMATALLTGIVAETDRFSNARTTSNTMNASAKLMTAGANQQLVATKLETAPEAEAVPPPPSEEKGPEQPPEATAQDDGSLQIDHVEDEAKKPAEQTQPAKADETPLPVEPPPPPPPPPPAPAPPPPPPEPPKPPEPPEPEVHHEHRRFLDEPPRSQAAQQGIQDGLNIPEGSNLILEPPSMGGRLSASSSAGDFEPGLDQLTLPPVRPPILHHNAGGEGSNNPRSKKPDPGQGPPPPAPAPPPPPPPPVQKFEPPPLPPAPEPPPPPVMPPQPPAPLPPPPPPKAEEPAKLPRAVIDVMDDRTLDSIEGAVKSPHQLLKNNDKTLEDIEQTVDSPHLTYESHESEPAETSLQSAPPSPPPVPPLVPPSPPEPPAAPPPEDKKDQPGPVIPKVHDQTEVRPTPSTGDTSSEQQARNAVTAAINARGDGRTSLPPLDAVASTDFGLDLGHQEAPPPQDIHIDPNTGMLSYPQESAPAARPPAAPLPPANPTAPPPVPPPMMPLMPPSSDDAADAAASQDLPQTA